MLQRWRRVTIRGLMLVVAAAAGLSAVYRVSGAFGFSGRSSGYLVLQSQAASVAPWTLAGGNRQRAAWMLAVASAVEFVAHGWAGHLLPGLSLAWPTSSSFRLSYFRLLLGAAWRGLVLASRPVCRSKGDHRGLHGQSAGLLLALPLVMMFTYLPVQTAFLDFPAGARPARGPRGRRGPASTGRSGRGCSL